MREYYPKIHFGLPLFWLNLTKVYYFVRVGYLLHIICLFSFIISYLSFVLAFEYFHSNAGFWFYFFVWLGLFSGSNVIFSEMDAYSRYQNFKQIRDQLYVYGFRERILVPVLKSRCQRDAAQAAGDSLGCGDKVNNFFYEKGYRWYHIVPDFFWRSPQFLMAGYFWQTTFFVKHYKSRYFD